MFASVLRTRAGLLARHRARLGSLMSPGHVERRFMCRVASAVRARQKKTTSKDVDQITQSKTLTDALRLVEEAHNPAGAVVTRRFAVAALRRLANLADKSHRGAAVVRADLCVDAIMALLKEQTDDLSARDVVDVLHSACKLEVNDPELEGRLHARALQVGGDFRAGDITRFVWVLARGGLGDGRGVSDGAAKGEGVGSLDANKGDNEANLSVLLDLLDIGDAKADLVSLLERLDRRALEVLGSFAPKDISLLVWAAARVGWRPSDALLYALTDRAQRLAPQFLAMDISNLLWGLARLQHPGGLPLLVALCDQLRALQSSKGLTPQEMVDLLWACAEGGSIPPAVLDCVGAEATRTRTRFKGLHVASLLGALASCETVPSPALLAAMLQQANLVANSLRPRDMSAILYALARSGTLGQGAKTALLLQPLLGAALAQANRFDPRGLSNVLWALAAARVPSHAGLWRALCLQAERMSDRFGPMDIANLLDALAKARKAPHPNLLRVLVARTVTTTRHANTPNGAWSPHNVSSVLLSVASLGLPMHAVRDMVVALLAIAHSRRRAFTGREVSVLMWALAVLDPTPSVSLSEGLAGEGHVSTDSAAPLGLDLLEWWYYSTPITFTPTQRLQLHQYFLSLASPPPPSLAALASECEEDWRQYHLETMRTPGALPRVVAARLGELGVRVAEETVLLDTGYSVDLRLIDLKRVVVEVHGPTHYVRPVLGAGEDVTFADSEGGGVGGGEGALPQRLTGASHLKLRLLRARGWTVVIVPFFALQGLSGAGEERRYIQSLLEHHGINVPSPVPPSEPSRDADRTRLVTPPLEHMRPK